MTSHIGKSIIVFILSFVAGLGLYYGSGALKINPIENMLADANKTLMRWLVIPIFTYDNGSNEKFYGIAGMYNLKPYTDPCLTQKNDYNGTITQIGQLEKQLNQRGLSRKEIESKRAQIKRLQAKLPDLKKKVEDCMNKYPESRPKN